MNKEFFEWLDKAIETIKTSKGFIERIDNKKFNAKVYLVKNIIRVDIKIDD